MPYMLLAGALLAYLLARQDLLVDLLLGGVIGAKLLYVLRAPTDLLTNPLSLLIPPQGPLAGLGALAGAVLAGAWALRRRPDRLALLDRVAAPLALGLSVAAMGGRGPGAWASAPALALAALAAWLLARRPQPSGHRTAHTAILACLALAVADLARPAAAAALFAGISLTQLLAAFIATGLWVWTRISTTDHETSHHEVLEG